MMMEAVKVHCNVHFLQVQRRRLNCAFKIEVDIATNETGELLQLSSQLHDGCRSVFSQGDEVRSCYGGLRAFVSYCIRGRFICYICSWLSSLPHCADKFIGARALPGVCFLNPLPDSSGQEFKDVYKESTTGVCNMALEMIVYDQQTTTHGMLEFVSLMKSSYTDLPTSKAAIGKPASRVITALRAQTTNLLLLYNLHHLPLGLKTVSNLEDTLHKYFLVKDSFERFKTLHPLLRRRLTSSILRAEAVSDEYVRLASELKKSVSEGKTKLRMVKLELDQKREYATRSKQTASDFKSSMGPVSAVGSAMGGAYLATLMETSSLIAVSPATAAVVGAGVMGATLYQIANSYADKYEATEEGKLEQGLEGLRKINKYAISSV